VIKKITKTRSDQGKKQRAFLAAYATLGVIYSAASAARIHASTHYDWLKRDPRYVARFEEARERVLERLVREADRRAVEGLERLKFHDGAAIIDPRTGRPYIEREYSDVLLMFRIKKLDPSYRERHEVTGPSGGPVEIALNIGIAGNEP